MTKNPVFIALASLAVAGMAHATTISLPQASGGVLNATVTAIDPTAWSQVDLSQGTVLPTGAAWTADSNIELLPNATYPVDPVLVGGDPCTFACSPYYGGVLGDLSTISGAPGWETASFWTVFDLKVAGGTNEATLRFDERQGAVSLLWGSPDMSNEIEFLLGDVVVGSFFGAELDWFNTTFGEDIVDQPGRGSALLTLSGLPFDGLRFRTYGYGGTFEMANITTAPVPVPAAALLMVTALGALGAVRRTRRERPNA
ncbi:VPLPA-CTERM sorting domain-containing protein [Rhodovulum marinum]|uniref:Putative secreted protein n=1 Tax=Rhodovulum marinum TaxID=320662 RepID=A0A4R2Q3N4_9RHOB|nr:VPLPA-CTERM sorting domain-containing protein [Rhodovulum marinum]TCP43180.1 putative secreted protein [Rhodovulum marinum]